MKQTSPLWYLAAFLLVLATSVLAIVVAAGAWDPVREASVTPVGERVDGTGKSLVNLGGDIAVHVADGDEPWPVGVASADGTRTHSIA